MERRAFLAVAAGSVPLAGCLGDVFSNDGGNSGDGDGGTGANGGSMATTDGPAGTGAASGTASRSPASTAAGSLPDHPATANLADSPHLGPAPGRAAKLIVAFEDPSCPSCRRFESQTFPKIRSKLVAEQDVSFAFRVFPHVRPWADRACQALFATHAREEAAFWELKDYYFENQNGFSTGNVLSKTRDWLASNTGVDVAAVVADAEAGAFSDAIQTDMRAVERAGVEVTPTFFLFKEREFVTKIRGGQGYEVFASALQ